MDDHFIYPSELVILLVFLFAPALLIALAGQAWHLHKCGLARKRLLISLIATALLTVIPGTAIFLFGSMLVPRVLGTRDLWIGTHNICVLPLAFILAALVAPAVTWLAKRRWC